MLLLPNYENAYIEDSKFLDYLLNEGHPAGKHKAILFKKSIRHNTIKLQYLKRNNFKGN